MPIGTDKDDTDEGSNRSSLGIKILKYLSICKLGHFDV